MEPFARQIVDFVRQVDPDVTFALAPPIDPGIWILYLYVRQEFVEDLELGERIADREVNMLIEHDVALATLLRRRATGASV